MIHLKLIFIECFKLRLRVIVLFMDVRLLWYHLLKGLFSPIKLLLHLYRRLVACVCMDLFIGSLFHWSICKFLCQYCTVLISYIISKSSRLLFSLYSFSKLFLALLVSLPFHISHFYGNHIKPIYQFGRICILLLSLP